MKKTNKFIVIALTLAMTFAMLAACGPSGAEPTSTPKGLLSTPRPTPEATPEPTPEAAPEQTSAAAEPAADANPFAGEYELATTNPEGEVTYFEEFIVEEDGTIHGIGDASGMTTCEGAVNEDGTFHCDFTRLGGTMDGTIDKNGQITGTGEIRGRNYTYKGVKFGAEVPANDASFAGEYEVATTNPEGEVTYFEEFIVEEDGTIHGIGDASGMTTCEGTIDADGTFHCDFTRLGGTMDGTIGEDGTLTGTGEIRGRNYTYEGSRID